MKKLRNLTTKQTKNAKKPILAIVFFSIATGRLSKNVMYAVCSLLAFKTQGPS